jgi:CBS domain-containing protein
MKAADVMVSDVVTVGPETPIRDVAATMIGRRISGVPVVDAKGTVLGIVSEGDLIRRPELETDRPASAWLNAFLSPEERARDFVKTHGRTAGEVMTSPAVCVEADTPLAEVVRILARHRVKRVPVLRRGVLAGVVTRTDLLRALLAHEALPEGGVPPADAEVRERVLAALKDVDPGSAAVMNVQVADGVAHLWGAVESDEARRALRVAVESVRGVKSVVEHLVRARAG